MRQLSFLFFILFYVGVIAQKHTSVHYTEQNVLPNNTVRSLFKSNDGSLWIGTDNGLVRKYNNQFTAFYKEDGLSQNNIWAVTEDQFLTTWIGSYGQGLSTYRKGAMKPFHNNKELVNQEVTQLMVHKDYLYIGTSDGISIVNTRHEESVKSLKPKLQSDQRFRIQDFFLLDNEVYAVTYLHGIHKIVQEKEAFELLQITDERQLYAAQVIDKDLFLSGKESFQKIAVDSLSQSRVFKESSKKASSIFWDYRRSKDSFYAAAWGVYDNDGGVYELVDGVFCARNKEFGIQSTQVISLEYDKELDRLFVGTLDQGFYEVYLNSTVSFETTTHDQVVDMSYLGAATALLFNDGLQIGDISVNADLFKKWQLDYLKSHKDKLPKYKDFFYELNYNTKARDIIFYSLKTNNNEFWINTSIGLYGFSKDGSFKAYLPLHTLEFNFTVSGNLIETNFYHGSRVYDKLEPLSYTYYDNVENKNNPSHIVKSLRHNDKTYFTSIFSGLYAYQDTTFTSYIENEDWLEKRLRHITDLGDSQLAVSNEDGDVFIINDDKTPAAYKLDRNYAYGNTINFLTSYKDRLIIGTSKGVVLYKDGEEIFIDKEQGLDHKVTSGMVKNDTLFLGSDKGLFKVALLDMLQQEDRVTTVKTVYFKVNGVVKGLNIKQLSLHHDENSIRLKLTTNLHPFPKKLLYSYRINENEEWIPLKTTVINLPYLQPAFYDIQVKIEDASTGAIFQKSVINFTVNDPFYQSSWFIILCFSIVIGILYTYFSLKRKRAQQLSEEREAITKRVEEVKLEALLSQMNPHFVFNSLNSVQYFISNNENDRAMKYLGTFAGLMRANLNNSSRQFITLEEEIAYLNSYTQLENARFDDRISILFKIDKELSLSQVSIPNMVLQPFVENAFVHAFPSRIESPILEIQFLRIDEDHYRCVVKDNGIGNASFTKNKRHISKGMQLVQERLSFLGYDPEKALRVHHTSNGTTITLDLEM